MINIADAETHECLWMRLLGAILRSVWVCAKSPVGCPLNVRLSPHIYERMFPHKPHCGSYICFLQTVVPWCPISCLHWLEWKTICQTYYIFGRSYSSFTEPVAVHNLPYSELIFPSDKFIYIQTNTLSPDYSINHAHFTWNMFTIAVSLYETHLMLLIEETGFLLGVFLAVSDTMVYRKAQRWLLVPYVRLSDGNVSWCRNCFSEGIIILICTTDYEKSFKKDILNPLVFFSFYAVQ